MTKMPPNQPEAQKEIVVKLLEVPASARVMKIKQLLQLLEEFHRKDISKRLDLQFAALQKSNDLAKNKFIEEKINGVIDTEQTSRREDLQQRLAGFKFSLGLMDCYDHIEKLYLSELQIKTEHSFNKTFLAVKANLQSVFREVFQFTKLKKQTAATLMAAFESPDPATVITAALNAWDAEVENMWKQAHEHWLKLSENAKKIIHSIEKMPNDQNDG